MAAIKHFANQYRKGGERVLWVQGLRDDVTADVAADIRAKGFKCWRSKDRTTGSREVWVNTADINALCEAGALDGLLNADGIDRPDRRS